jgi:hypothetical protein
LDYTPSISQLSIPIPIRMHYELQAGFRINLRIRTDGTILSYRDKITRTQLLQFCRCSYFFMDLDPDPNFPWDINPDLTV